MTTLRHTRDVESRPYLDDDKNRKAIWEAEGGEPLYMLPRFKTLRLKFTVICVVLIALSVVVVGIIYKKSPPNRIFATTLLLGPLVLTSIVPILMIVLNYKSSDDIIIWLFFLSNIAMLFIGFSLDFIMEHVIMKNVMQSNE